MRTETINEPASPKVSASTCRAWQSGEWEAARQEVAIEVAMEGWIWR